MGRIKQLILWSEEVMDEVYPHLSEVDREFVVMYQEQLDAAMNTWFIKGLSVEDGAKVVLTLIRDLQYEAYWNERETYLEALWEARVS